MFWALAALSTAAIQSATWEQTQKIIKGPRTFVLAISSDSYDFSDNLKMFVKAVHQSRIEGSFIILDTYKENLTPEDLGVLSFPAIIYYHGGKSYRSTRGDIDVESVMDFMSTRAIPEIPTLTTEQELQDFLNTAGMGVICAYENASEETLPILVDMHQDHFDEISVAWCDPKLIGKEGFYVYRHVDDTLAEVNVSLFGLPLEEAENALSAQSVPEIFKGDPQICQFMESETQAFIDIVFQTNSEFYLSPEQIRFAKTLKQECNMNVTYETFNFHFMSMYRYGFPEIVEKEEVRIIDVRTNRWMKYIMDGEMTIENAKAFCSAFKDGTARPYWKSAPVPTEPEPLRNVVASNIGEFVAKGWSAIGFYHADDNCLDPMKAAAAELDSKGGNPYKLAEFALAANDWPLEETSFDFLPRLLIFKDGVMLENMQAGNTTEAVIDQLLQAYKPDEL